MDNTQSGTTQQNESILQQELNFKRAIIAKTKLLLAEQENELSIAEDVINEHKAHIPSLNWIANHVRPAHTVEEKFFDITSVEGKSTFGNQYFNVIDVPIFNAIFHCSLKDSERKYQHFKAVADVNRDIDIIPSFKFEISEINEVLVSVAKFVTDDLLESGPFNEMRKEGHTRLNLGYCILSEDDAFETKVEDRVYNIYVVYIEISEKALPSPEEKYSLKCNIIPQEYHKDCHLLEKLK